MSLSLVEQEPVAELRCTVERMLEPEIDNPLCYLWRNRARLRMSRSRFVTKSSLALFPESLEPLLAGLLADAESIADLNDSLSTIQTFPDKSQTLGHV